MKIIFKPILYLISILSFLLNTLAVLLFIPPILIWGLSAALKFTNLSDLKKFIKIIRQNEKQPRTTNV